MKKNTFNIRHLQSSGEKTSKANGRLLTYLLPDILLSQVRGTMIVERRCQCLPKIFGNESKLFKSLHLSDIKMLTPV